MARQPSPARLSARAASLFVAIGLLLYAAVYAGAERLAYRTGHANALFKIATLTAPQVDWVILGASHAMPLDFADFNATMQRDTGLRIVNLASPGTGPLYNRFVFEQFLARHRTAHLLYVVDSFAFADAAWNEDRFTDSKLLARTPFDLGVARRLAAYCAHEGVDWRAWLDYVAGFSKINNRDRFDSDIWTGEKQFERVYRPSAAADRQRIAYLYPDGTPRTGTVKRYLDQLAAVLAVARQRGIQVDVIKMPIPARFRALLPDEARFDAQLAEQLQRWNVPMHDFSSVLDKPAYYFDTDHLNRAGVTALFAQQLRSILVGQVGM